MKKLTPGGMALIVGTIGDAFKDNIGRVVRTIYHEGLLKSPVTGMQYDFWYVEVPDGAEPLITALPGGQFSRKYFGNIPTVLLMPLDNEGPDTVQSSQPVYGSMGAL